MPSALPSALVCFANITSPRHPVIHDPQTARRKKGFSSGRGSCRAGGEGKPPKVAFDSKNGNHVAYTSSTTIVVPLPLKGKAFVMTRKRRRPLPRYPVGAIIDRPQSTTHKRREEKKASPRGEAPAEQVVRGSPQGVHKREGRLLPYREYATNPWLSWGGGCATH